MRSTFLGIFIQSFSASSKGQTYPTSKDQGQDVGHQVARAVFMGSTPRRLLMFSPRAHREFHRERTTCASSALSCLEEAVWTSSQCKLNEAHYAFAACCVELRSPALAGALLREQTPPDMLGLASAEGLPEHPDQSFLVPSL